MRIKSPALYVLLLIFVCFAAGILSVVLRPDRTVKNIPTIASASPSPTEDGLETAQRVEGDDGSISILILGVDHIADPEGRLLAVWLLSFRPDEQRIELLGLPLDLELTEGGHTIENSFNLWNPPEYGASFINQLGEHAPSPLRGFIALDEHGFAVLLDYFGGAKLDDQILEGASVIGSLRLTDGNPQAALKLQAQVLESLRTRVGMLGITPELTPLTALSPVHAYTSPSPPELATLAIPLLPLTPEMITINTYVP